MTATDTHAATRSFDPPSVRRSARELTSADLSVPEGCRAAEMATPQVPPDASRHEVAGPEGAYLRDRLIVLDAAAIVLCKRAALMSEPEAAMLLSRALKRQEKATRIRQYLRTRTLQGH